MFTDFINFLNEGQFFLKSKYLTMTILFNYHDDESSCRVQVAHDILRRKFTMFI